MGNLGVKGKGETGLEQQASRRIKVEQTYLIGYTTCSAVFQVDEVVIGVDAFPSGREAKAQRCRARRGGGRVCWQGIVGGGGKVWDRGTEVGGGDDRVVGVAQQRRAVVGTWSW